MGPKLHEVFGVSAAPVLSYVTRLDVDGKFQEALGSDKQVVVYGASKQGKTSLVSKYLPYGKNIVVRLTPVMTTQDIYHAVLRDLGIKIKVAGKSAQEREMSAEAGIKFTAMIPFFGKGSAEAKGGATAGQREEEQFEEVPFNLALAQDVSELIKRAGSGQFIILENFHYLDEERQKQFAFDLRTFQEVGIRFVILGVWREKNRLAQYDGDLLDRIVEIPVEPWVENDFRRVAETGAEKLNIQFAPIVVNSCIESSFSSVGVFQELLKEVCRRSGVTEYRHVKESINDGELVKAATNTKGEEYGSRHQRALESIAAGYSTAGHTEREGNVPLFLPYYLVKTILEAGYPGIANGMPRNVIQDAIKRMHHRGEDVRPSDMSNLLYNLANLQAAKKISPPIIDFDRNTKQLQVVDSTFYFFLKFANLREIESELPNPLEGAQTVRMERVRAEFDVVVDHGKEERAEAKALSPKDVTSG
ncbi:MAG TPA: hypothetical protein VJP02_00460 [Candidatus Sulfotelmatobacter sp.]|nr:hypothetical protein [Candidatus Sulfotelmatobacter sp.]